MKGGRRSRYAAAATGPITAANVPATPQAQNPGAHLLIDDILDAQEFQRRINLGLASPEGNEVLAGCNAFWLPVRRTSDIVPSNFDPVQQYALTQAQLDAITNRAYPFPHAIDSAEPENRTLYISGLDQVTEDNLPPIMANVLNVMPTNIPFLQDHQGNYLKSLRTGRCYKNFGNMVPNGVSTHEVGAFFGLYENLGAQLKDDMHDRVHRDAHIQPSSNHQRNLKNKWERDFGGIAATTKGPRGKDKSNASDHATGTMNRLNGQQAQTLHRVVWTVDATGQYMQQSRPRKIANTSATNYQGLWYTVPPAQNVDGMMLDFVNATTRYAPTLSSYLLTHPNAHVVGGAAPARAPPTAAPAVVAGPSAAAEADDSDAEEGAVGPSAALEEENSMMGEDEPVDSVMVDEQLSEEEYVGKGKGRVSIDAVTPPKVIANLGRRAGGRSRVFYQARMVVTRARAVSRKTCLS